MARQYQIEGTYVIEDSARQYQVEGAYLIAASVMVRLLAVLQAVRRAAFY